MIDELRFNKSRCHVEDAAIMLATNQDPWRSEVLCSLEDWFGQRRWNPNNPYGVQFSVLIEDFPWAYQHDWVKDPFYFAMRDHRILLRPSGDVREGWVALSSKFTRSAFG